MISPQELLIDEARRHHDVQIAAYRDADTKAIELLKVNGVSLGLIVGAVSLLSRGEAAVPSEVSGLTATGLVFLVASSIFAAAGFTRSELRTGIVGFQDALLVSSLTGAQAHSFALEVYGEMIAKNRESIETKARRVDWGIGALIVGVTVLAIAAFVLLLRAG